MSQNSKRPKRSQTGAAASNDRDAFCNIGSGFQCRMKPIRFSRFMNVGKDRSLLSAPGNRGQKLSLVLAHGHNALSARATTQDHGKNSAGREHSPNVSEFKSAHARIE
jgi:hypothetical protein